MPDFSPKAVHQFWRDYRDPIIYRVISFMEGMEDWTFDEMVEIETVLKELGDTLENIGNVDLQQESAIIQLASHIKTGRGLRLLMCLDMAYPGAAAKVLMHAEEISKSETDTAGTFLKRNLIFERLRLLARVFAPDRLKLALKTLEESN